MKYSDDLEKRNLVLEDWRLEFFFMRFRMLINSLF